MQVFPNRILFVGFGAVGAAHAGELPDGSGGHDVGA